MTKRKTHEEFVKEAREVHGLRFSYIEKYVNQITSIKILCNIHNFTFNYRPSNHILKKYGGCRKCSGCKWGKSNKEEFVEKANAIHGLNKYRYDKTNYSNCDSNVEIFCVACDEYFLMTPSSHLNTGGCRKCGYRSVSISLTSNTDDFIKKAKKIFGVEKYDYSMVRYTTHIDEVSIICKKHGPFKITPSSHLANHGCPGCCNKTEGKLFITLVKLFPNLIWDFRKDWCKNIKHLPFDFCIPEYNIIIELDGRQHFQQVSNWRSPEEQFKIDMYKEECANDNGYSLIRLVQEDVLNDSYDWMSYLLSSIEEIRQSPEIMNMYLCGNGEYDKY
jgi:very-short-patch-repair endonuclease